MTTITSNIINDLVKMAFLPMARTLCRLIYYEKLNNENNVQNLKINLNLQSPYIEGMSPREGPESGGTLVQFMGGFLNTLRDAHITVSGLRCEVDQEYR